MRRKKLLGKDIFYRLKGVSVTRNLPNDLQIKKVMSDWNLGKLQLCRPEDSLS
ncbi:hypothetical protein AA0228_1829 [Gluconobacter frateurii NRIC 0228]|uniref:Transposase n=1 Tax=Gluconobacter frateurii NRIC 0228 TaxID=1307946 RepID=A0ABQ0QC88_9PROT|nr:hypothetical protein AA0228_1829 [Gluconobacter frateurii NRIC 0228]